jgi:prevent-host-death family protein
MYSKLEGNRMKTVTFTEFRKRASGLLSDVENGEVVIVLRHGKPVAEISPYHSGEAREPAWKRAGLRLSARGIHLARAILEEREAS